MQLVGSMIEGIRELTGVELTEADFANVRHSLMTVLLVVAHHKAGELSDAEAANVLSLTDGLLELQLRAHKGEQTAQTFLKGVGKLVFPPKMLRSEGNRKEPFLPFVNDLLSGYRTSPHLIHAWNVRLLMSELSFQIEPAKGVSKMTPNGKVRLGKRKRSIRINKEQRKKVIAVFKNASDRERARMTLEGLAKKIYIDRMSRQDRDAKMTEGILNRSLRMLRDFEETHPEEVQRSYKLPVFRGEGLPYQIVTQDCKPNNFF